MIARLLIAVCIAFGLASASHAQIRKPTAPETKIVRDCFEQKGDSAKGDQCVGLVSARCVRKPENQGGLSRADCYRIEQVIWDVLLNETYKALQGDLDEDEQKIKLRDMQRAWIASRDATCEFYYHKIQGSMSVPMTAACLLNETARRALLLAAFGGL